MTYTLYTLLSLSDPLTLFLLPLIMTYTLYTLLSLSDPLTLFSSHLITSLLLLPYILLHHLLLQLHHCSPWCLPIPCCHTTLYHSQLLLDSPDCWYHGTGSWSDGLPNDGGVCSGHRGSLLLNWNTQKMKWRYACHQTEPELPLPRYHSIPCYIHGAYCVFCVILGLWRYCPLPTAEYHIII